MEEKHDIKRLIIQTDNDESGQELIENDTESEIRKTVSGIRASKLDEEAIEQIALKWFPEKTEEINRSIDGVHGFAYGYLEGAFAETLIALLKENSNKAMIRKYCDFMELIWREGDDRVINAMGVTVTESLVSESEDVWIRFGHYLSGPFRDYINKKSVPGNVMYKGRKVPLLTAGEEPDTAVENGSYKPETMPREGVCTTENRHAENPFHIGNYNIITGRIERYKNHPDRLLRDFGRVTWTDVESELHMFCFGYPEDYEDCYTIIINRFPSGQYLSEHIADAFLQSVLFTDELRTKAEKQTVNELYIRHSTEMQDAYSDEELSARTAELLPLFYENDWIAEPEGIQSGPDKKVTVTDALSNRLKKINTGAFQRVEDMLAQMPSNLELIGNICARTCGFSREATEHVETYMGIQDNCLITVIFEEFYTKIQSPGNHAELRHEIR